MKLDIFLDLSVLFGQNNLWVGEGGIELPLSEMWFTDSFLYTGPVHISLSLPSPPSLNLAALMEPLLRGSKSWKCSDTLIRLVLTCSCILAIISSTSTNSGGRWEDWGEGPEKLGANNYVYGWESSSRNSMLLGVAIET